MSRLPYIVRQTEETGTQSASGQVDMAYLVRALIKYNASDLHIKAGRPPLFRVNGKLVPAKMSDLTAEQTKSIICGVLSPKQISILEEKRQIDLTFRAGEHGRFRCNMYFQKGSITAAIRMIPGVAPQLSQLGVPEVMKELSQRRRGLLLITGSAGAGKSTTLAALTQYINENDHLHILTIEDPIEYVYTDVRASITQREVGSDVNSMEEALVAGLRQDPDIIVIGEMRDAKTISTALTAAETGHLVISTLHTRDAKSTIDRILDVFEGEAQKQVRVQLASTLIGVVCQRLVMRADGSSRIPACEVLVKSPAIEGYIVRNELDRIPDAIANSKDYYQMQSMNQALRKLILDGTVTLEEALKASSNPDDLQLQLSGVDRREGYEANGE